MRNLKAVRPQIFAKFSTDAKLYSKQHNPPVSFVCFSGKCFPEKFDFPEKLMKIHGRVVSLRFK